MSYCNSSLLQMPVPSVAWALSLPRPAPVPAPGALAAPAAPEPVRVTESISKTPPLPTEGYVRVNEIAAHLGVHRITVHQWVRQGYLPPATYIGPRLIAWPVAEIENWLLTREKRRPGPASHKPQKFS